MEANLISRLEAAIQKLESLASSKFTQQEHSKQLPQIYTDIDDKLAEFKQSWMPLCKKIGPATEAAGNALLIYFQYIALLFSSPEACKTPSEGELMESIKILLGPLSSIQEALNTAFKQRSPEEQLLKAIQAATDISKCLLVPAPIDYFKEVIGQVEYYNNRVRMNSAITNGKQWASQLTAFLRSVQEILQDRLGNHKLIFKGQRNIQDFLKENGQIQQQSSTEQMSQQDQQKVQPSTQKNTQPQTKTEVKEPKIEYKPERKLHIYENVSNQTIDLNLETFQNVQIFNCTKLTLNIIGKANSVNILQCNECLFKAESIVSQFEMLRSKKCNIQITQQCPTMSLENNSEIKIYLSNNALNTEIIMSCCSDTKVIEIEHENEREHVLPTHFSYKLKGEKMEVKEVDMGFE